MAEQESTCPYVISPIHGIIPIRRVPNPNKDTRGCVALYANNEYLTGRDFFSMEEKVALLRSYKSFIVNRQFKQTKYVVQLHYGVNLDEHLSRDYQEKLRLQ